MINGIHGLFYSPEPEATRAFFRDVLRLPFVDEGDGWLIFNLAKGEFGIHPAAPGDTHHEVSLYTADLDATIADLRSRGADLTPVVEADWGRHTTIRAPGGVELMLYQPK
jgi:catechol 2,3-dioxygenase-like lactoylglutathione lyase family enzyme